MATVPISRTTAAGIKLSRSRCYARAKAPSKQGYCFMPLIATRRREYTATPKGNSGDILRRHALAVRKTVDPRQYPREGHGRVKCVNVLMHKLGSDTHKVIWCCRAPHWPLFFLLRCTLFVSARLCFWQDAAIFTGSTGACECA